MRFDFRKDIRKVLGTFWTNIWRDEEFVNGFTDAEGALREQSVITASELSDNVSRSTVPLTAHVRWKRFSILRSDMREVPWGMNEGLVINQSVLIGSAEPPLRYLLPWDKTVWPAFMCVSPSVNENKIMRVDVDYEVHGDEIFFNSNPFDFFETEASSDSNGDPVEAVVMWGNCVEVDVGSIEGFTGIYAGLRGTSTKTMKRLSNAVWDLMIRGVALSDMNAFLGSLTDSDTASVDGTVLAVFTEAGRTCVVTEKEALLSQKGGATNLTVGDPVEKGDNPFNAFFVKTALNPLPPEVVPSVTLGAGFLGVGYKGPLTFVNADVPLTFKNTPSEDYVDNLVDEYGNPLTDDDGNPLEYVPATTASEAGMVDVPLFEIGGAPEDVELYRRRLAATAYRESVDLFQTLTFDQNPPFNINPFDFIRKEALLDNTVFVGLDLSGRESDVPVGSATRFLSRSVPAGTCFLMFIKEDAPMETYDATASVEEELTGFIAGDLSDEYSHSNVNEAVAAAKKVG